MHRDTYIPHSDYITPYPEHALEESMTLKEARTSNHHPHAQTPTPSHATTTEVIYCYDKTRPGRLLHTLPKSEVSPNVTLNYRYQDITTDAITFIYSCYFIYFRVFYVHMPSHAFTCSHYHVNVIMFNIYI